MSAWASKATVSNVSIQRGTRRLGRAKGMPGRCHGPSTSSKRISHGQRLGVGDEHGAVRLSVSMWPLAKRGVDSVGGRAAYKTVYDGVSDVFVQHLCCAVSHISSVLAGGYQDQGGAMPRPAFHLWRTNNAHTILGSLALGCSRPVRQLHNKPWHLRR